MSIWMILKVISALATAATGLLALIKPTAVYGFTGLTANGVRGVSEIRAIFGGLLIALGLAPLFLGPVAYQMLGIGYLGIAVARAFSIVFDKCAWNSGTIIIMAYANTIKEHDEYRTAINHAWTDRHPGQPPGGRYQCLGGGRES